MATTVLSSGHCLIATCRGWKTKSYFERTGKTVDSATLASVLANMLTNTSSNLTKDLRSLDSNEKARLYEAFDDNGDGNVAAHILPEELVVTSCGNTGG